MVLTICKGAFIDLLVIWIYFAFYCFDSETPFYVLFSEAVIAVILLFIFSLTKFLISSIISFIKRTFLRKVCQSFPMSFSILEVTFITVLVNRRENSLSVTLIVSEFTLVKVSVYKDFLALPFLFSILKLPNIFPLNLAYQSSIPVEAIVIVLPLINLSILEFL